jgi:hypothetical protein
MIMILFRGMRRPDLQYLAVSVREVKYTHLGYITRVSRLHTLDPHSATPDPEQENNQATLDKSQVTQAGPSVIGLYNSNQW